MCVVHDFLNDPRGCNAIFTADPAAAVFMVSGLRPNRSAALLGAGRAAKFAPQWRALANGVSYSYM
jgi:hypothetical protein